MYVWFYYLGGNKITYMISYWIMSLMGWRDADGAALARDCALHCEKSKKNKNIYTVKGVSSLTGHTNYNK